eukprot:scaffold59092_cov50-Attheya_sp.AAC.3
MTESASGNCQATGNHDHVYQQGTFVDVIVVIGSGVLEKDHGNECGHPCQSRQPHGWKGIDGRMYEACHENRAHHHVGCHKSDKQRIMKRQCQGRGRGRGRHRL